jgi:hypothetical protein
MAAGLGFKTFTTGEVLTSADTNGYLMQGVLVFADAAARDAAITSPQEGQFAYLKDTNVTTYYTGSAWANLDTTGMTNPMTTTADMIYSSSGSTPARLGIGTIGQVLTVNSGATAPEWAAPAGGGKVLQVVSTTKDTTTTNTNGALLIDTGLTATITPTLATSKILVIFNHNAIFRDNASNQMVWKFFRDATQIYEQTQMYLPISIGAGMEGTLTLIRMDEPATTSALTYKSQFRPSSSGTVTVQSDNFPSSLTLMEIGA